MSLRRKLAAAGENLDIHTFSASCSGLMDFILTEEQRILRDTLSRFMQTGPRDTDLAERWRAPAELGALGIGFPEDQGGLGGGPREMELVLEAAGESRRTEPLIDALAMPGASLVRIDPDRVAELGTGATITVAGFAEEGDPVGLSPGVELRHGALFGRKTLVPGGACAARALVSARDGDRLVLAEVALDGNPTQPMMDGQDGLRLRFDGTPAIVLAEGEDAEAAIRAGCASR
ncbi:acyl-CoA dehydrogenase family protein [Antarcticimicrobium sediminis]|uniref:Acyl-CoA dehydrogenase/oxidase N-terminal domain-containing protein n=1 Tax=Antarcticimicrobium sediminis TaxID=2546227 RepID=A0A4R5EFY0_9RHOB|nr:acyl-CoA dehydrogenase family protein [Antarcticimicrobium sediminis]TDE33153.1 hypothetical protein E1B25_21615 [Antarcticimicrobium sediminis]